MRKGKVLWTPADPGHHITNPCDCNNRNTNWPDVLYLTHMYTYLSTTEYVKIQKCMQILYNYQIKVQETPVKAKTQPVS